ncbi:hypothetical protein EVAR_92127_1 [Eumeta japonica]|uniref:Uncharacterized protein n=1 Tax=Eumeta variegata TaxID=151549 RepID=A0A4C1T186_EUMVA|nr:hypothetical protein EVAR_92127_1 [Eumeta japonica]
MRPCAGRPRSFPAELIGYSKLARSSADATARIPATTAGATPAGENDGSILVFRSRGLGKGGGRLVKQTRFLKSLNMKPADSTNTQTD